MSLIWWFSNKYSNAKDFNLESKCGKRLHLRVQEFLCNNYNSAPDLHRHLSLCTDNAVPISAQPNCVSELGQHTTPCALSNTWKQSRDMHRQITICKLSCIYLQVVLCMQQTSSFQSSLMTWNMFTCTCARCFEGKVCTYSTFKASWRLGESMWTFPPAYSRSPSTLSATHSASDGLPHIPSLHHKKTVWTDAVLKPFADTHHWPSPSDGNEWFGRSLIQGTQFAQCFVIHKMSCRYIIKGEIELSSYSWCCSMDDSRPCAWVCGAQVQPSKGHNI